MSSKEAEPSMEREQAPAAAQEGGPFAIVGVGASAGGIEAVEGFLREVKPDVGAAIVIVLHQPPQPGRRDLRARLADIRA
jgi:two-component system CheB/CheR fusion protein